MKHFDYSKTLSSVKEITPLDCSDFPDCTIPDLNVDLYEMLIRQQNGDITTLGGMIRQDAQYSSEEDCNDFRVAPDNDPDLNLITAKNYAAAFETRLRDMIDEDNAFASKEKPSDSE